MRRDCSQCICKFRLASDSGVENLVEHPQHAMTRDAFRRRELAERAITADEDVASLLRER
jgi:hypothetical protein